MCRRVSSAPAPSGRGSRARPSLAVALAVFLVACTVSCSGGASSGGASDNGATASTDQAGRGRIEVRGAAETSSYEVPFTSAALEGQEHGDDLRRESSEADSTDVPDPFLGWRGSDYQGTYLSVTDGERRTYEPRAGVDGAREVWMFGGSALFGYASQRDEHTVPSELVRAAESDGVALRVRNFGHPGYLNYQETMQLAQLLSEGERPDVVIFHDGYNDRLFNIGSELLGNAGAGDVSYALFPLVDQLMTERFAPDRPARVLGLGRNIGEPVSRGDLIDRSVALYLQGADLARELAEAYDFSVYHTLQPDVFSKDLVDGEPEVVAAVGYDDVLETSTRKLAADYRDGLVAGGVIDFTQVFDDTDEPVMVDAMHVNERGAAIIGAKLWTLIRGDIDG